MAELSATKSVAKSFLWCGLTGSIATGKSSASNFIRAKGYTVIDADKLAHKSYECSSPVASALLSLLTREQRVLAEAFVAQTGSLDRSVFADAILEGGLSISSLEQIIHPYVQEQCEALKRSCVAAGARMAFYDVPLLFEKKLQQNFDVTLCVSCTSEQQLKRLMRRDECSEDVALQKISRQINIENKQKMADIIIDNSGSLRDLELSIEKTLLRLSKL